LGLRPRQRIARPRATRGRVITIPLRKAAAGSGAKNQDFHGLPLEETGPPAAGPAIP
jgi:hypothetical protein